MPTALRRVAVIGASGFIGSHLADHLARLGSNVLAFAGSEIGLARMQAVLPHCQLAACHLLDTNRLQALISEFHAEVVYHMAAHPDGQESFDQIRQCINTNLYGLTNALEASARSGVSLFVYGDTSKVHGDLPAAHGEDAPVNPFSSYAISKFGGWGVCKLVSDLTSMNVVSVRPEFTYGPRQSFNLFVHAHRCITQGKPIRLQGGAQTRDPLFVEDLVDLMARVIESPRSFGRVISAGGGREFSIFEMCQELVSVLGASIDIEPDAMPPRLTEIWRSRSDNSNAYRLLGWVPTTGLRAGLAKTYQPEARPNHSQDVVVRTAAAAAGGAS